MKFTVDSIMDLLAVLIVASAVLPDAVYNWVNANQTGWSAMLKAIWNNVITLGLIAVMIGVYRSTLKTR